MKQNLYFYGLILLTAIFLAHGLLTATQWSFITAGCMGFLAIREKAGNKPGAPHAKKDEGGFGSKEHLSVYTRSLSRCMNQITMYRYKWQDSRSTRLGDHYWLKYDRAKCNYALLFDRYEKARKEYGWKTQA